MTEESQDTPGVEQLLGNIAALESEIETLRRRLLDAPKHVRILEERLIEQKAQIRRAVEQNDRLTAVLEEAREQLTVLREEVEKLSTPPNPFGTVLKVNDDGTVDVLTAGRKMRVNAQPTIEVKQLQRGQEVLLNESFNLVDVRHFEPTGEIVTVKERIDEDRLVVVGRGDEEKVVEIAEPMRDQLLRAGDHVRLDGKADLVLEKLARPEVEELVLEEVPDITYEMVGGLRDQIETIRDAVELPYVHKVLFDKYDLEAPKGVLLYGPPGCGKTLIAKAAPAAATWVRSICASAFAASKAA